MATKPRTATEKLLHRHLLDGALQPGHALQLRIDQTLTQDATGTLVMLELEALGCDRVQTDVSVQYVDHNLLQADHRNPDDHLFLHSACRRFGIWYSRPGNGISHPLHMQCFGRPGDTLLGSDSHTCAAGALGMLAIGAGGIEVALAMVGEAFHLEAPGVWGVRLDGELPPWVSAKDVVLEMLRRHGVAGGLGYVIEYCGEGVRTLDIWDRHVIANMGAELGATTSVFPSDARTRAFLQEHGRRQDWTPLEADPGARYDALEVIDLAQLEPLIAAPSSPGNVKPVREVAGTPIYQSYVGSSANPAFRDFAVVAGVMRGARCPPHVSLDINPSTCAVVSQLVETGALQALLDAGARIHQPGCNGCIGMGQAPATGRHSLRTVPRNFPGRSGTREDSVWLCSPETAAASALRGEITDPRELGAAPPRIPPPRPTGDLRWIFAAPSRSRRDLPLSKGPNIVSLPQLDAPPDTLVLPVLLEVGDDVSTDDILPAGSSVLPLRSNVDAIAEFCFQPLDDGYATRARKHGAHAIVAGKNYGQGSSREHAALAPRHLGLRLVLAESFARIHHHNLIAMGVLPLRIARPADVEGRLCRGATIEVRGLHEALERGTCPRVHIDGEPVAVAHELSQRARDMIRAGGAIGLKRQQG